MNNFADFIDSLTLDQAIAWANSDEKTLYIDYEILGPADIRWNETRQDAIENRFSRLLVARFVNWDGNKVTP